VINGKAADSAFHPAPPVASGAEVTWEFSMRRVLFLAVTLVAACAVLFAACGGDDGGGKTVTAQDGKVTVTARDVSFDVKTIDATPGTLTVTLIEKGSLDHTFVVEKGDTTVGPKLAVSASKDQDSGAYDLKAGDYVFFCDIPGHRAQGMEGNIVVK
jgi:plastocyanin